MAVCSAIRRHRGLALILAVVVVTLLTFIVVEFAYEVQVDATLANNALLDMQADYAARSAVNYAKSLLTMREGGQFLPTVRDAPDSLLDGWAQWTPLNHQLSGQLPEPIELGETGIRILPWEYEVDEEDEFDLREEVEINVYLRIVDEDAKINVNRLVPYSGMPLGGSNEGEVVGPVMINAETGEQLVRLYERLVELFPGVPLQDPAAHVLVLADWMDADETAQPQITGYGSESDYYRLRDVPYMCKNGPLDSIDEMLLIHRYGSRDLMFGRPVGFPGLQAYLTVHGSTDGRINVNTAPEPVLVAALGPAYEYLVDRIVERQMNGPPFKAGPGGSIPELGLVPSRGRGRDEQQAAPLPKLKTESQVFSCDCRVEIHDFRKEIRCVLARQVYQSKVVFKTMMWKELG